MKKILSITLALLLTIVMLSGCGDNNSESADVATEVSFDENIMVKIGDQDITKEELDVYLALSTSSVQSSVGNAKGWEETLTSNGLTAKDTIIQEATETLHVYVSMYNEAKNEGVYTKEDEESYFSYAISQFGGEEQYQMLLTQLGLKDESFKKMVYCEGAINALAMNYCSDEDAMKIYTESGLCAQHVLILFEGKESEEAAYNEAMDVYTKAINGENFDTLIEKYNEDPGQTVGGKYVFTPGEMVNEFYGGTQALEIGGISEPVKTSYGYHIIKRCELPEVGSDEYLNELNEIKQIQSYSFLSDENVQKMTSKYPMVINETEIRKIDLNQFSLN